METPPRNNIRNMITPSPTYQRISSLQSSSQLSEEAELHQYDQACQRLRQDHKYQCDVHLNCKDGRRKLRELYGDASLPPTPYERGQRIERYCIHFLPGLCVDESFCDDVHDNSKDQEMFPTANFKMNRSMKFEKAISTYKRLAQERELLLDPDLTLCFFEVDDDFKPTNEIYANDTIDSICLPHDAVIAVYCVPCQL